jgi:large subunit ribosomal protein L3
MRMAGRMGHTHVKMINLQIIKIIPEQNIVLVKGAVPGAIGAYVKIERWS